MHGRTAAFVAALVGAAGLLTVTPASAEPSHGGPHDTCDEVLGGPPTGGLEKVTDPPDGSTVAPGQVVAVTLRWDPAAFTGDPLHKVIDCVTIEGALSLELSHQQRDPAQTGTWTHTYTVPDGAPAGARVCDRALVSGPTPEGGFDREKSNEVCFEVGSHPTATTTTATTQPVAPGPPGIDTDVQPRALLEEGTVPPALVLPAQLPATGGPSKPLLALAGLALTVGGALLGQGPLRRSRFAPRRP